MSFEKDEGEFKLEKLTCNVDSSTTYTAGDGLLGITLNNPFMPQAKLEKVYAKLKGTPQRALCMSYRLFFLVVVFLDGDFNLDAVLLIGCDPLIVIINSDGHDFLCIILSDNVFI